MSEKEIALDLLRRLPEEVSLETISEEIATLAAIRRGVEAVEAGRVVSHAEVRKDRRCGCPSKGRG